MGLTVFSGTADASLTALVGQPLQSLMAPAEPVMPEPRPQYPAVR
jgi:hypothetical protein